jgi:hypothetical protein
MPPVALADRGATPAIPGRAGASVTDAVTLSLSSIFLRKALFVALMNYFVFV